MKTYLRGISIIFIVGMMLLSGCSKDDPIKYNGAKIDSYAMDLAIKQKNEPEDVVEEKPSDEGVEPVITTTKYTKQETIPFKTVRQDSDTLENGVTKVHTVGVVGSREIEYMITYHDGVAVSEEIIGERTLSAPVNEVILVGKQHPKGCKLGSSSDQGKQLMHEINYSRCDIGVAPLVWSDGLAASASIRAKEIIQKFSHERPDGSQWYTVDPNANGENIAYGYYNAQQVHVGFQNSPGHRENNERASFHYVGISAMKASDGSVYWAVLFGN